MNVVVLGAGIIGVTTAFYMARAGYRVTVIEAGPDVAMSSSAANAGLIVPSQALHWNAPGVPLAAIKSLLGGQSPLLLHWRLDPDAWIWLARFGWHSNPGRYITNARRTLRLAAYSLTCLKELRRETGIRYSGTRAGILSLLRSPAALKSTEEMAGFYSQLGIQYRMLDSAAAVSMEPALAPIQHEILGAVHTPGDESGDAQMFSRNLAALAKNAGVEFQFGCRVLEICVRGSRVVRVMTAQGPIAADAYVVALGCAAREVLAPVHIRLPTYPIKGYSVTLPIVDRTTGPSMPLRDASLGIAITPLGDRLRIAGLAELAGRDDTIHPSLIDRLRASSKVLLPLLSLGQHLQAWAGHRPMTPEGPPILGTTRYRNLFLNSGHGALGWTLACGCGRIMADLVAERRPEIDIDGLSTVR